MWKIHVSHRRARKNCSFHVAHGRLLEQEEERSLVEYRTMILEDPPVFVLVEELELELELKPGLELGLESGLESGLELEQELELQLELQILPGRPA